MVWQPLQTPVTLAAAGPQNTTIRAAAVSITANVINNFFNFVSPSFVVDIKKRTSDSCYVFITSFGAKVING
jgi:hypothetical protein